MGSTLIFDAIRAAVDILPLPLISVLCGGVNVAVYEAKPLYKDQWLSVAARDLTMKARRAYDRYGNMPHADYYDAKSAIYLASAQYSRYCDVDDTDHQVREWLSMRFIPGDGFPQGTSDFDECSADADNESLALAVQKKLLPGADDIFSHFITMSRVCRITALQDDTDTCTFPPRKLAHAALLFALINNVFYQSYKAAQQFSYITGLYRSEVIEKSLTTAHGNSRIPVFVPATTTLGYQEHDAVKIDRRVSAFRYPSYFLDMKGIVRILATFYQTGRISLKTLQNCFPSDDAVEKVVHGVLPDLKDMGSLGHLLTAPNYVPGSYISGDELRDSINRTVEDGPRLFIMKSREWYDSVMQALGSMGAQRH